MKTQQSNENVVTFHGNLLKMQVKAVRLHPKSKFLSSLEPPGQITASNVLYHARHGIGKLKE